MYKKIAITVVVTSVLFFLGVAPVAAAIPAKWKDAVVIADEQEENVYAMGETVTLDAHAHKDVIVFGGDVVVNGDVEGNLYAAGGNVVVNGRVAGDINVAGGAVIINSDQPGDVRMFAGVVFINSPMIDGDLAAFAGQLSVGPNTQIGGTKYVNSGTYSQSVQDNPTTIAQLEDNYFNWNERDFNRSAKQVAVAFAGFLAVAGALMFIGHYFVQLAVIKFFPVLADGTMKVMKEKKLQSVMAGVLILFASPFIGLALLLSVFGIPFLGLLVVLAMVVVVFSSAYPSYLLGDFIFTKFKAKKTASWLKLGLGYLVLNLGFAVLLLIPFLGWALHAVLTFAISMWAIGGMLVHKWDKVQANK